MSAHALRISFIARQRVEAIRKLTPHQRPHTRHKLHQSRLNTRIVAGRTEPRVSRRACPAYSREEPIFAEDRNGIYEKNGNYESGVSIDMLSSGRG
jgi:hypothetical protein